MQKHEHLYLIALTYLWKIDVAIVCISYRLLQIIATNLLKILLPLDCRVKLRLYIE